MRIFPLYYLYLLVTYYLIPFLFNSDFTPLNLQLPYYLYLQNLNEIFNFQQAGPGHFWTLAVEEHFYCFWPALVYFVKPKNLDKIYTIAFILILGLKFLMISKGYSINYFTFTRIDQIMIGSILALLEFRNVLYTKRISNTFWVIILLILPLGFVTHQLQFSFPSIKEILKYPILGLLFFAVIGLIITNPTSKIVRLIFLNKVIQYAGKISYGIYVWHMVVIFILQKSFHFKNIVLDLAMVLLFTLVIAHFSYHYWEMRFLKLKDKLSNPTILK